MSIKKQIKILIKKGMEGFYYAIRTTLVDFDLSQSALVMDTLSRNQKQKITNKEPFIKSFLLEDLK
ncbi:MAG: hypothetical protein R6V04_07730 [bacterium]